MGFAYIWTKKMIAQLGERPDPELAELWNISVKTVARKRKALGIATKHRKRLSLMPTKENIELLKSMNNSEAARFFGLSRTTIFRTKILFGIDDFTI